MSKTLSNLEYILDWAGTLLQYLDTWDTSDVL